MRAVECPSLVSPGLAAMNYLGTRDVLADWLEKQLRDERRRQSERDEVEQVITGIRRMRGLVVPR